MGQGWINICGKNAALLAAIEVGLGSLLHSFRIPFTGQFLSLNQGAILTRASVQARHDPNARWIAFYIGNIAAVLKSLSPAGKKLTPMLAISAQGGLFSLGTLVFGVNPVGVCVGMALLSVWAFAQPILIYYILYGETLLTVADYFFEKLSRTFVMQWEDLALVLGCVVFVKLILAIAVGLTAYFAPARIMDQYQNILLQAGRAKRARWRSPASVDVRSKSVWSNVQLALRDLFNPLFIISLILTGFFFFFVHSSFSAVFWGLLRPVAVGFLLFFAVRSIRFDWALERLNRMGLPGFSQSLQTAIQTLKRI